MSNYTRCCQCDGDADTDSVICLKCEKANDEKVNRRIAELEDRNTKLLTAATLTYRWLYDSQHTLEQFEDIAEWFYKETGFLRPGKDDARAIHTNEQRANKFQEWCGTTGILVREGLKVAIDAAGEGGAA